MGQQESSLAPPSSAGYLLPSSHELLGRHASYSPPYSSASSSGGPARRPRLDMRWSRLTMDQLRDEEFLTKQLRRMETLLGASARRQTPASSGGKSPSSPLTASNGSVMNSRGVFASATPSRLSLQQRLIHGKSGASSTPDDQGEDGAASESDRSAKQFELANGSGGGDTETEIRKELDLLNALYLFGELEQPELAALMLRKLKELLLRLCSFPDPFYDLLALRRYILRSVHEAVQVQHQHQRALVNMSASALEMFQNVIRQAQMPQLLLLNSSGSGSVLATTARRRSTTITRSSVQGSGDASSPGIVLLLPIKPKEKVSREASMGIQVVFALFSSLIDQSSTSLAQQKEILAELVPLVQSLPSQSLVPKTLTQAPSTSRGGITIATAGRSGASSAGTVLGSTVASESQELVDRIQRFLLEICPAPSASKPGPSSPKVQAVASSSGEFDVTDRTNAVNALIYLAAARSSLRDFLLAVKVILGASDFCSETKDGHQHSLASLVSPRVSSPLTSSVPLLRAKQEDQHPASRGGEWDHEDENVVPRRKSKVETACAVELKQLGASKYVQSSHRTDPETTLSSTYDLVNQVKRKALPKGFVPKAIGSTSTSTTVNVALSSHPVAHHHHHKYASSPIVGAAGGYKSRMKEDLKELLQNGNAAYSLDISAMQDNLSRDGFASMSTSRLDGFVQTVKCPKLKSLSVLSVLRELDLAKVSIPQKATARLTTRASQKSSIGTAYGDFHGDSMLLPDENECEDKEVWSCGQNSYGELGHGDTITRKSFDRIEALQRKDVVQVSAGNEHSIMLCGDGTVLTCGYNDNGQCGVGVTNRVSNITEIHKFGAHAIAQVHAYNGCEHSVVVTQDGRAATFGYNYRGQLGHGNTTSENVPKLIRSLEARIVRLVSCSYYHTILTCDEAGGGREYVYTFGRNDYGQLGHNDTIDRKVPHHIEMLADQHIVSVACGQYHTMVVSSSGKTYGFGKNDYGQLGIDFLDNQLVPVQVRSGLEKHVCLEIRCGYYHSIVLCGGAHLFGFGRNDYGQLGLGKSNATAAANLQLQQQRFAAPQLIEELEGKEIIRFACGCYHTVAVSDSGVLYVFGRNNHGQLGTGDTTERLFPFPIEDFLGKRIAMVAAGFYHTIVLTGGKEEEKCDQDGDDNGNGDDESNVDGQGPLGQGLLGSSSILSAQKIRQIIDSSAAIPSEGGETGKQPEKKKNRPDEVADSCVDPSWNPDEEDCRDEDDCQRRERKFDGATASLAEARDLQSDETEPTQSNGGGVDSVDAAVIILAELDRLCKPYLPKHGVYPALQHPSSEAIQLLQTSIKSSPPFASFDVCGIFGGCFEVHVIHTCSSTFESLCVLLKHLSGKKIEHLSRAHHHGSSQSSRASIQGVSSIQLQVYVLLVCVRLLQANLAQLLRSGLGKTILLVAQGRELGMNSERERVAAAELPPCMKELERMLVVIRQLRDSLMSLVDIKLRSTSIFGSEADPTTQEMTTKIASEAVETLMLGFELFFSCQCEQRQFFLYVIENHNNASTECCSCDGTGKHPSTTETYPRSRKLLLSPLLRRMADDALVVKCLPLAAFTGVALPAMMTPASLVKNKSLFAMTSIYTALLERIGADFTRAIGEAAPFSGETWSTVAGNSRSTATTSSNSSLFNMVIVLQKHISTWAASCDRWVKKSDALECDPGLSMKDKVAALVDRVFRVDVHDVEDVPLPWRCFLEFTQAIISQSCDVFLQVVSKESAPSPSFGHMSIHAAAFHGDDYHTIDSSLFAIVEASIVGQVLPSVISSLLVFSNNPLFAAALFPHTKNLLHLLDDFNQRSPDIREADKKLGQKLHSTAAGSSSSRGKSSLTSRIGLIRGAGDSSSSGLSGATIGEVVSLPWSYLLEKEMSVLAAEMAMTLNIGDPLFVFESSQDGPSTSSLLARWLSSPLFTGGLSSSFMRNSIRETAHPDIAISDATRIVQHVPLWMNLKAEPAMTSDTRPFSLVLPPHRYARSSCGAQWIHGAQSPMEIHEDNFVDIFSGVSIGNFLDCMSGVRIGMCCAQARVFCDWIRAHYAKTNASYRMLTRQAKLPPTTMKPESANDGAVFQDESCIEYAAFAAILYHNQLAHQALHFALSIRTGAPPSKSPPRVFLSLWHFIAELRRRFSAKKMEIKNSVSDGASQDGDPSIAVTRLQRAIVERCQLLLMVSIKDEEEHEQMMLDEGFVSPHDPPLFGGENTSVAFSSTSMKKHMNSVYLNHQVPFLVAFPSSKWRKVRILVHVMTRWRWIGRLWQIKKKKSEVSSEILDFLTTDEPVSSFAAVNAFLVDPCRRASCAARGLESMCEVLSIPSFESIQADVVHRFSQVIVFQSHMIESSLTRTKNPNSGLYFKEQYNAALTEFLTQVTKAIVQKSNLLFGAATTKSAENDAASTCRSLVMLLSCWAIHFKVDHFEFVNDIGILSILQELSKCISKSKQAATLPMSSCNVMTGGGDSQRSLDTLKSFDRLEDTLWVLFRHICAHFAVQNQASTGLSREITIGVPTDPALSDIFDLIFDQTLEISQSVLGSTRLDTGITEDTTFKENIPETARLPSAATMRRSFEIIWTPKRFSSLSKGLSFTYEEMINPVPSGCPPSRPAMSPLVKPNEFSITTWIYTNSDTDGSLTGASPMSSRLSPREQEPRFIFLRGNHREIAPYLILVPESDNNWHFELGLLINLRTEQPGGNLPSASANASKYIVHERLVSKEAVSSGKWTHVAIVCEASKVRLYINGILDTQRNLLPAHASALSSASVDLPFHFGRFPLTFMSSSPTSSSSLSVHPVVPSLRLLASTLVSKSPFTQNMGRYFSASENDTGTLKSFEGSLSNFRFHNRSLSPIHVRIVYDEKKQNASTSAGTPRTLVPATPAEVHTHRKLLDQLAVLLLLSSSSEGLVHFTTHASKWLNLLWGLFIKADEFRVQQSVLRVLRAILPHQRPLVLYSVLVNADIADEIPAALGFISKEDVFVQQIIRIIGFTECKCPNSNVELPSPQSQVKGSVHLPWTLMLPVGAHGNELSPPRDELKAANWNLQDDMEKQEHAASTQSLALGNELIGLLHHLYALTTGNSRAWRDSIQRTILSCMTGENPTDASKTFTQLEQLLRIGQRVVSLEIMKMVEGVACFHVLSGVVDFMRPGATIELTQAGDIAHVIGVEPSTSNTPAAAAAASLERSTGKHHFAYVSISDYHRRSSSSVFNTRSGWGRDAYESWYDQVLNYAHLRRSELDPQGFDEVGASRPRYLCVNTEDIQPMRMVSCSAKLPTSFVPSILYARRNGSEDFFVKLIPTVASKCLQQLGSDADELLNSCSSSSGQLAVIWKQSSSLVMKALVQASAYSESAHVLLRDTALVDRVIHMSTSEDGNASFGTCAEVERKVWLLRQRVYKVLVDMGDEGDAEIQQLFQNSAVNSRRPSELIVSKAVEKGAAEPLSAPEALKNEDEPIPLKLSGIESRRTSRRRSEQKNDDDADEAEDADPNDEGLIRDDSSAEAKEDGDEPDEDEDDVDNGNGDDDELEEDEDEGDEEEADEDEEDEDEEENRAEFVEELMLMGFPEEWCILALKQTENDIVCASAWIVDNLEYLSRLQTSLDKQRDRGRETPRFNEEEDDNVAEDGDDATSIESDPRDPLARASRYEDGQLLDDDPSSSANKLIVSVKTSSDSVAPPLNDKEMARKVFGEMYFPFDEGGYRSNTRHCFMQSWRAEAVEMKLQSLLKSQNPLDSADAATILCQDNLYELSHFRSQISQMELKALVNMLQDLEHTLSVLYARQCIVTLWHHLNTLNEGTVSSDAIPMTQINYSQFFQLLKMVLLRGNQFSIIVFQGVDRTARQLLQERTPEQVLSSAIAYFLDRDFEKFLVAVLDFCVTEIEKAASNKSYDAHLWTQRELKRADKAVNDEPAIEIVSWVVDVVLKQNSLKSSWKSSQVMAQFIKRLRFSLKSANLPLKFLGLHMISVILQKISKNGSKIDFVQDNILVEGRLEINVFLHAAKQRHAREVVQHRLVFSVYLQAYVEILHVLRELSGGGGALTNAKPDTICALSGDPFRSLSSPLCKASTSDGQSGTLAFDRKRCHSNLLTISDDGASVEYSGNEVWKTVFATESFSTGVVSWQVRIEKSSSSYLFVGVGNQRASNDSFLGADEHSWGYIGDKALYYQRNRVKAYGDNFGEGDCIGVTLDCERGTLSFSKNGVDFGVAFDNIVGEVCPAVAFYSRHQRVSFVANSLVVDQASGNVKQGGDGKDDSSDELDDGQSNDDSTTPGSVEEALVVCELMKAMINKQPVRCDLLRSAFEMTTQWITGSKKYVTTRAGKPLWVDITRDKCSEFGFQSGERVRTSRGNGVVVGIAEQRLWVEVDDEQGAWFFHPSKLRSLTLISVSGTTSKASQIAAAGTSAVSEDKLSNQEPSTSSPTDDSSSPLTTTADSLSFAEFQGIVNDSRWSLSVDRELMSILNDFCETSSVSPWNISPSEALDVLKQNESELESAMAKAGFSFSTSSSTSRTEFETKIVSRLGFLRFFNAYFSRVIGYFDLTWHYFSPKASLLPCKLVSKCRGSLFLAIKNEFFTALTEKTANSPKKADDDYDYPEDLPQVLLNRPKAATAKCHPGSTKSLFLSLFGQAFEELHFLPLRTLRMVYSHPMDDGQLRSFKVKFEGEGVDDYGGPYREFFSQFFAELQMLRTEHENDDDSGHDSTTAAAAEPSKIEVTPTECLLPFLVPSPNWRNGVGANREKFVISAGLLREPSRALEDANEQVHNHNIRNSNSAGTKTKQALSEDLEQENPEEKRQLHGEMFFFLGQMLGTCLRTRVCVRLDLAISVWKHLAGEIETSEDDGAGSNSDQEESALTNLKEVDFVAYTLWKTLRGVLTEYQKLQGLGHEDRRVQDLAEQLEAMDLTFTVFLSDGQVIELCENGANKVVTLDNLDAYLKAVLRARMGESNDVMNIIKQGLNSILPVTALSLFTWKELEKRVCGVAEVDVNLLKQNTEYDEDVSPQDEFVQRFWRVLAAMDEEDKRCFLRFVWARSRLPAGTAQFHQKFKIQSVASSSTGAGGEGGSGGSSSSGSAGGGGWMDSQLPKSHTCFFALQLPRYSTDEICRKQMLYAVRNCVEMDGDFRLADTEMTGWNDIDPSDQLRF